MCLGRNGWEICLLVLSEFQRFFVDKEEYITLNNLSASFILAECHIFPKDSYL